jgi:hypothetical protein
MRGGARPGAGRKKGATNTKTAIERAAIREKVEAIKSEGDTPLEVLLRIMRTAKDEATIIDCAKAAAPYVHPKLNNIQHSGDAENPVETVTRVELSSPEIDHSTNRAATQTPPHLHRPS